MGRRLARRGVKPDLIVSSPALRALTTAQLLADELGYPRGRIVADERLYGDGPDDALAIVGGLGHALDSVMLVGHNPGFSVLAGRLSNRIVDLPTCAVAEFGYDTQAWSDVGAIAPAAVLLDTPKR
jgi:phosphohistidine phosphatase